MSGISGRILGVYRHAQKGGQKVDFVDLAFFAGGVERFSVNGEDLSPLPDAFFFLAARDTRVDFDLGPDRINWVISLSGVDVRPAREPWRIEFLREGSWLSLPMVTSVGRERVPGWLLEFDRLWEAQRNPLPKNLWRVELGVQRMLSAVLESETDRGQVAETPASRLKAWLDADRAYDRNIEDVCEELGYSDYHLRELFGRAYGVSPQVYRSRCRMALAMDLIAGSTLSLKEIAAQLGFRHFSHFSASFQRAFALSPRSALRRYRFETMPAARRNGRLTAVKTSDVAIAGRHSKSTETL
jgi:AraC-like DNA-binding protein